MEIRMLEAKHGKKMGGVQEFYAASAALAARRAFLAALAAAAFAFLASALA